MRDREIYYDARRDDGLATAKWREPTRSDRLPVHRSESPTGYSSAGCSPAEPASASPVTDIVVQSRSSAAIKMRCSTPLPRCSPSRSPSCPSGTRVSSLLCTPGDISILRRHPSCTRAAAHLHMLLELPLGRYRVRSHAARARASPGRASQPSSRR